MRIVIVLLLLANLTLYAYTRLDTGGGEAMLLQDQVQPDKVKLLSPQQVAALGPVESRRAGRRLRRVGPVLRSGTRARTRRPRAACARTVALAEARRLRHRILGQHEPVRDACGRREPDRRPAQARRQGPSGRRCRAGASSRSLLGHFRNEVAAIAYAEDLAQLGVKLAKVEPRDAADRADARRRARSAAAGGRAAEGPRGAVPGQRDQDHRVRARELTQAPIRHATSAADIAQARALFEEYAAGLGDRPLLPGLRRGARHAARRLRAAARLPAARRSARARRSRASRCGRCPAPMRRTTASAR